eukprot:3680788-Prymnesium_polylepis.1
MSGETAHGCSARHNRLCSEQGSQSMKTQSGGVRFDAASARMPSSVSVVLPRILSLRSIQYAEGSVLIDSS